MSAPRKIWVDYRRDMFSFEVDEPTSGRPTAYHHDDVVRELVEALRMIADTEPPSPTWAGDLGIRAIRAHARAALAKIAQHDS